MGPFSNHNKAIVISIMKYLFVMICFNLPLFIIYLKDTLGLIKFDPRASPGGGNRSGSHWLCYFKIAVFAPLKKKNTNRATTLFSIHVCKEIFSTFPLPFRLPHGHFKKRCGIIFFASFEGTAAL